MPNSPIDIGTVVGTSAVTANYSPHDPNFVSQINGIRVFDVGQGDCIGILDQYNEVFCYVDYGGNNDHPDNGNPNPTYTATRLNVQTRYRKRTHIILTHWDKDHYWSANKKNPSAQNCHWLIPRQYASPQAVRFANRLTNVEAWPESLGNVPVSFSIGGNFQLEIRKCDAFNPHNTNQDRNSSGLALVLKSTNPGNAAIMILPGDCPFDQIPHLPSTPVKAIVAYHHGASSHWTTSTQAAISSYALNNWVGFSYGKNSYGHPVKTNYAPNWSINIDTHLLRQSTPVKESADLLW